jgi:outer membrane protein OmpA-like peptidoglycan-associated protein
MKLSQRRAEEVKRLMVKKYGIDENRISVDWKGKTVAFGDIHYELNRRVSFYRVIE